MLGKKERNNLKRHLNLSQNALNLEGRKTEREVNRLMDGG